MYPKRIQGQRVHNFQFTNAAVPDMLNIQRRRRMSMFGYQMTGKRHPMSNVAFKDASASGHYHLLLIRAKQFEVHMIDQDHCRHGEHHNSTGNESHERISSRPNRS